MFKAKTFLKELGGKVEDIQEEINTMRTRVKDTEEKTHYRENAEFKAEVWEQINEFKRDEEEIVFRKALCGHAWSTRICCSGSYN